ncbi:MAG TPA: hypothetical protein VF250_07170 [Conexibacter sp.]
MSRGEWSEEHMRLARLAGTHALRPERVHGGDVVVGAITTRDRERGLLLTALWHRTVLAQPGGECSLETVTLVRDRILGSRTSPGADPARTVARYLDQEARHALALRSLDAQEGETTRDGVPIGRLTVAREAILQAAAEATLEIDGIERPAAAIAFGVHSASWADVPELGVAAIVYARDWPHPRALASVVPPAPAGG